MKNARSPGDWPLDLPPVFYEQIIKDIPITTWAGLLQENPTLSRSILEGFTGRSQKLSRLVHQPYFRARMRRVLQTTPLLLEEVLKTWTQEQLPTVAFLEMLDSEFLKENWTQLKDILGPARFFAGLFVLGYLQEEPFRSMIDERFWDRHIQPETGELLLPLLILWKDFARQFPQVEKWMNAAIPDLEPPREDVPSDRSSLPREGTTPQGEGKQRKLEKKLAQCREEEDHLKEQITRYRRENEELRAGLAEWERSFQLKLDEALTRKLAEWYHRYESVDEKALEDTHQRLELLLGRTERAFELQREADEKCGTVSAVRQQMLRVDLYLREIEKIYADSLLVHSEIARVKRALLKERERLLDLPGINKVFHLEPSLNLEDLRQKILLLEPEPSNLLVIYQLEAVVNRLADLGFIQNPQTIGADIDHKRRQIFETLYASSGIPRKSVWPPGRFRTLDDFVKSGESKGHDLYIDGYNILFRAVDRQMRDTQSFSLSHLREGFVRAVHQKSRFFRKVYLIFDGLEDSRDRRENLEIVYADKSRGLNADMVLMQALKGRKDKQAILVTGDEEIIKGVENHVFAMIDPSDFLLFVFGSRIDPTHG